MLKKKVKIVLLIVIALIAGMLSMNMYLNRGEIDFCLKNKATAELQQKAFLQREEINKAIRDRIEQDQIDQVAQIYKDLVGNLVLVYSIIGYAVEYDIPVSLLFSIIYVESSFNPKAINKNSNGTYDYGLMSLNSKTFKGYSREQLFNIETNLRLGCEYLVWLKKRYKTWGEAVIHYNGLYTKGAGSYMVKVMEKEREFEKLFNEHIQFDKLSQS
jgi:soluble lytic murein transglycosylase-like protein